MTASSAILMHCESPNKLGGGGGERVTTHSPFTRRENH